MNTFKTAVVLATLLGVGYGVHVVLNKPHSHELSDWDKPELAINAGWQNPLDDSTIAQGDSHSALEDVPLPNVATPGDAALDNSQLPPITNSGQASPIPRTPEVNDSSFAAEPLPAVPKPVLRQDAVLQQNPVPPPDNVPQGQYAESNQNPTVESQVSPPAGGQYPSAPASLPGTGVQNVSSGVTNQSAFEQMWQAAQSNLSEHNYSGALFTLSILYSDPSLTGPQRDRLIPLLDQLAGKVFYSAEHWLESPYTIQSGETLAQIAADHAVTSEYLARVNGLDRNAALTPGQQIKVVRGPFRSELSLERREITVFVGRYYAGRFNVGIGRELPVGEMSLEVAEKSGARAYVDSQTRRQTPAGDPTSPYGNHWIGLRSPGAPVNPNLGLHSTGERVDASDTRGCISVSDRDADDLQAIFSIGSQFTIVR